MSQDHSTTALQPGQQSEAPSQKRERGRERDTKEIDFIDFGNCFHVVWCGKKMKLEWIKQSENLFITLRILFTILIHNHLLFPIFLHENVNSLRGGSCLIHHFISHACQVLGML